MRARSESAATTRLVVGLLVVGALLGLGWSLLAPGLPVGIRSDGVAILLAPEARSRFDATGYFALASIAVGLLAGAGTWLWRRWRGPALLVAVALGSAASAVLALAVGQLVAQQRFPVAGAVAGSMTTAPPELGTWTLALLQPAGAVLAYTVGVAFARSEDPRGGADRAVGTDELSSARPGPAAAPGEPGPPATP